ncbi:cytochrome C556 [Paramagnetospirillum marisnigri]|uniref:Cytochrome C556 n=1 Tax=Paramagnetospirillum marisnigri TaxID=1285242 RepID=A0A178MQ31_9PROT|nr:cytochrome c [Paramagnetospirillum marisnigri]OAN51086.1 cytochrome C556 [Paramagnetospirillum marisnigri]
MRPGIAFVVVMGLVASATVATAEPVASRRDQLRDMVAQDCGSCHGMTRKGGLGSPLLPELLAQYPAEGLIETILDGRPGTPMPPWKSMLSRDDAAWMVAYLLGEVK